jgi:hypothetical protein
MVHYLFIYDLLDRNRAIVNNYFGLGFEITRVLFMTDINSTTDPILFESDGESIGNSKSFIRSQVCATLRTMMFNVLAVVNAETTHKLNLHGNNNRKKMNVIK